MSTTQPWHLVKCGPAGVRVNWRANAGPKCGCYGVGVGNMRASECGRAYSEALWNPFNAQDGEAYAGLFSYFRLKHSIFVVCGYWNIKKKLKPKVVATNHAVPCPT